MQQPPRVSHVTFELIVVNACDASNMSDAGNVETLFDAGKVESMRTFPPTSTSISEKAKLRDKRVSNKAMHFFLQVQKTIFYRIHFRNLILG